MNFIYDLHRTMLSQNLILVYQGDFTQESTKSILSMAERNLDSSGEDSSIKRKVFNVIRGAAKYLNIAMNSSTDGAQPCRDLPYWKGRIITASCRESNAQSRCRQTHEKSRAH
jgi:hypothetical protein